MTYYQRNKAKIALQRKVKFEHKTEKDRFLDFHNEMKNVCSFGCICCHRILTSIAYCKVKGGYEGLIKKLNPYIAKNCILKKKELPKGLMNGEDIYLCKACERWLKKPQMPPKCSMNGLKFVKQPPELQDLEDLEVTLFAKRILFIKIFDMPVSRWKKTTDRAINVPIPEKDILDNLHKAMTYPRLPDEAGWIPLGLKRKKEYRNTHILKYVRPEKIMKATKWLKENNPIYSDIPIENRFAVLTDDKSSSDESESEIEEEEEEEEEPMDSIRRNQFDTGGSTVTTSLYPEAENVTRLPGRGSTRNQDQPALALAPGEGKIPASLTQDTEWVTHGFPNLFPDGNFGLDHPRDTKLTTQQFFGAIFENVNPRCRACKPLVFGALNHIEKQSLESAMAISCRRGKITGGKLTNLEDAHSVFDNQPGTPRYWKKRKSEIIAKQKQLGPFHIFFTLSCADKRWDEVLVAFIQQNGLQIEYEPMEQDKTDKDGKGSDGKYSYKKDNIYVKRGEERELLRDFLSREDLPKIVKDNILTLTKIFDKRVHTFLSKIVMAPSNPMKTKFYHYRVEFQKRGAGHIHGVLWLDLKEIEKSREEEEKKENRLTGLKSAMDKLTNSEPLSLEDKNVLTKFVDTFVTCSLKDKDLEETVREVQKHSHRGNVEKRTGCYMKGPTCRFNYPRLPSERTIIAIPLNKDDEEYESKKKESRDILKKVKSVLVGLTEDQQNSWNLKKVLEEAQVEKKKYYQALEISHVGACIILKREVSEIYINNYNAEWLKAWDGNMDISVCLDFFAIITYITDYYTKAETDMMNHLVRAQKVCQERGDDFKAQMKHLVQTFLMNRQMGEMEAWYRILPNLHLSESNLKCIFIATGFPHNRSNFLIPVKDKVANEENDDEEEWEERGGIEIVGSDKSYKRVPSIHEKYAQRPPSLDSICLAQFAMSYETCQAKQAKKEKMFEGSSDKSDQTIISWNSVLETPLPNYIDLNKKLGFMKVRSSPAVLREFQFKEGNNAHEFYYSRLLLYWPWRKEEEDLHLDSIEQCNQLFEAKAHEEDLKTKIENIQEKLFPNQNAVEDGRAEVALLDDQRPTHIGDMMDPENEVENEQAAEEGLTEDLEHAARFPTDAMAKSATSEGILIKDSGLYKRIAFPETETELGKMREAVRNTDDDQRFVLDRVVKWVKQTREAALGNKPAPVFLKIHGGAGAGKTKLINTLDIVCNYFLRVQNKDMADPDKPVIMKLAPTGKAANHVDGLTLHKAYNLPLGNGYFSLTDGDRAAKRDILSNLSIVIIDEMSMVKADALYQIHMRLQEIKGNKRDFGGVSILLLGDLMQLPPPMAAQIFEVPKGDKFREYHKMNPLWSLFDPVELKFNHRQGSDKEFGDMLNRIRVKQYTEDDLKMLASRRCDKRPEGAMCVYGKNKPCTYTNEEELQKLPGKVELFSAVHLGRKKGSITNNIIHRTGFLDKLQLKIGARIMLVNNVDTSDRMSNGTCGYVVGFERSRGKNPEVKNVLIQFDDPRSGAKLRRKSRMNERYPSMPQATPIPRKAHEYQFGRKKDSEAMGKFLQFPLTLAWAITGHKCQGMNVLAPEKWFADLDSWFLNGQNYVMIGRVQNLDQLYLNWSYDPVRKKDPKEEAKRVEGNIKAANSLDVNENALKETENMRRNDLNSEENKKKDQWLSSKCPKIVSLNVQGSLQSRLPDLEADKTIYKVSDVICLQETGASGERMVLDGYSSISAGGGHKRGVTVFVKSSIAKGVKEEPEIMTDDFFQGLKVKFCPFNLITIYRASGQPTSSPSFLRFVNNLERWIDPEKATIICGDFNFDQMDENELTKMMKRKSFKQIVQEPTHIKGRCIDHVYHNFKESVKKLDYKLHYPSYSDHEAVCVMVKNT